MPITNEKLQSYSFLAEMSRDKYFPPHLVENGKSILSNLCEKIESQVPDNLDKLYALTHAATNQFNELATEFEENDSQIETAARDCIGSDLEFIAMAYGFDADTEELIATREW
jgi:hypothetical protein